MWGECIHGLTGLRLTPHTSIDCAVSSVSSGDRGLACGECCPGPPGLRRKIKIVISIQDHIESLIVLVGGQALSPLTEEEAKDSTAEWPVWFHRGA